MSLTVIYQPTASPSTTESTVTVTTDSLGPSTIAAGSLDNVTLDLRTDQPLSHNGLLADIQRLLKPGSNLTVTNSTNLSTVSIDKLNGSAILAGYASSSPTSTSFPIVYNRTAPTAAKLNLKKSTTTAPAPILNQVVQVVPTGWNNSTNDNDLIDEDSLLENSDPILKKSSMNTDDAGCATKRRACANCSCGRKELEENNVTIDPSEIASKTSSCGNCSKGDAFRCSTCPHLGKPAWIPGTDGAVLLDTTASDF